MSAPQAELPFSEESLEYISSLEIHKDLKLLEESFNFRPECLKNVRISSILLQVGALHGLTLADIGLILCRPDHDDEELSELEQVVKLSEDRV
jgi:hypothetical protein